MSGLAASAPEEAAAAPGLGEDFVAAVEAALASGDLSSVPDDALVRVMTAAVEIAWYGLATRIDPWRVVAANETLAHGVRPAHWVLLCGLGVLAIVTLRHILPLSRRQNVIA